VSPEKLIYSNDNNSHYKNKAAFLIFLNKLQLELLESVYILKRTPIHPALGAPGDTNRPLLNESPKTSVAFP